MPTASPSGLHDRDPRLLVRRSFEQYLCCDADLSGELVERIWQDPHALLSDGKMLQDKTRCTVVRLDHATGPFVWKYHNWGSLRRTIKRSLSQSCARKSWSDAGLIHAAGIPTPRPRAFVERRIGPFKTCSYQLNDYVPGTSLYRFMRFERPTADVVQNLARQVAAIWQQLDDLRVCHNDLKPENLLVDPQGKVWLIDLDRMRRCRDQKTTRRRQLRDAGDLLHPRNWRAAPQAAEVFRREILKTQAGATAAGSLGARHPLNRPVAVENPPSHLVTVLIPCHNAAGTIVASLQSVRDMADEILVADRGSTDDTLKRVREFGGCRIIEQSGDDEAAFETWANSHARHPWILRVLPHEQICSELGRAVQDLVASEPAKDGFRILRRARLRGHYLNHGGWSRELALRLYRRDAALFAPRDGNVEVSVPSNKIGTAKSYLAYDICPSVARYVTQLVEQATRIATQDVGQASRPSCFNMLCRAAWRFWQSYVLRFGWLDGWAGLHASCLSAIGLYLRAATLWEEREARADSPRIDLQPIGSESQHVEAQDAVRRLRSAA